VLLITSEIASHPDGRFPNKPSTFVFVKPHRAFVRSIATFIGGNMNHQAEVTEALRVIRLIRKYPAQQSPQAEKRVLSKLTIDAYIEVIAMLEKDSAGAR
jgi:hypothetical protein